MTAFQWILAALSLAGVYLNIGRHRHCFVLWLVTSASWCVLDLQHGLPAQAAVQACYFVLSGWGWWHWRPPPTSPQRAP